MIVSADSPISTILNSAGVEAEDVRQVIDKSFSDLFLQDIVSSQLDADRMDYLLRDSHFAGVNYGIFDLEWVLNCLCVGSYGENATDPKKWRLSLDSRRGLHAAEQLIQARQHMSQQVYYHRSTRRWEAVFLCMVREACRLVELGELPTQTPTLIVRFLQQKGRVNHVDFLRTDEPILVSAFAAWSESTDKGCTWLKTLSEGFLRRHKVLCHVEIPMDLPPAKETVLRQRLKEEFADVPDSTWELDDGEFTPYKVPHPSTRDFDPEGYQEAILASSILLSDGTPANQAVPVAERSALFAMLLTQKIRLRRLFCRPDLKSRMDKLVADVLHSKE